jgi:hypothetical protein
MNFDLRSITRALNGAIRRAGRGLPMHPPTLVAKLPHNSFLNPEASTGLRDAQAPIANGEAITGDSFTPAPWRRVAGNGALMTERSSPFLFEKRAPYDGDHTGRKF